VATSPKKTLLMLNINALNHNVQARPADYPNNDHDPSGCDRLVNIPIDYFRLLQQFDPALNNKNKRRQSQQHSRK
jgi:hypothetical protein